MSIKYPTTAAFLTATKSGEIPDLDWAKNRGVVGRSVIAIIRDEYKVPTTELDTDAETCGLLLQSITQYELGGQLDGRLPGSPQYNRQFIFGDGNDPKKSQKFMEAFDSFSKDYAKAVREYIALKQVSEDKRKLAAAESQRQAEISEQRMQEERGKIKAMSDANAASKRAEDEARTSAVKEAMQAQADARKKKLQEIVDSPNYRLWQASLRVEEGLRMIKMGQEVLDHDDAVRRESGVVDLAARRSAGEQVVAGKLLLERAFADYRRLGGAAHTPSEVRAGSDPAKEYR